MSIRRMPHAAMAVLAAAALLLVAAAAFAETSERPIRRRAYADRTRGEGVDGLTMLRIHGGLSAPIGDFSDFYDAGWGLGVSVAHGVSRNVLISSSVMYHRFEDKTYSDSHFGITPWTVNADYVLPTRGRVHPFLGGGVGVYHVSATTRITGPFPGFNTVSASENNLGINLGMGIGGPVSPRALWGASLKLHQVWGGDFIDTPFFAFQFGFGFLL